MSKRSFLSQKVSLRTLGAVLLVSGAVFAAAMAFLVTGTALFISLLVGALCSAAGAATLVFAYKMFPGEMPKIDYRETTLKVTVTALLLGFAALTKFFSLNIVIFGGSGMRVGLGGVFTTFPAIFFGPLYGGMASAASDILGCIISPIGPYNPLFTLTAFAGGFIKGLVWLLLFGRKPKNLRLTFAACFLALTLLGGAFYVSFAVDGIAGGVIAEAGEMPSKGYVQNRNNSFLTSLVVKRVSSKDTYSIVSAADVPVLVIPGKATVDGADVKVAVHPSAFDALSSLEEIYIPETVSAFDFAALYAKFPDAAVYLEKDGALAEKALSAGFHPEMTENFFTRMAVMRADNPAFEGLVFESNQNYAKNLAGYINYAAFGTLLVGLLGLLTALGEYLWSRFRKERNGDISAVRIFAMIFTAEMVQTTVNTVILKEMTFSSAWASYPFMVVWLPRAAEGLLICLIQAYLITLLYSIFKKMLPPRGRQKAGV